jgi:hypothetical protein
VSECDREASINEEALAHKGLLRHGNGRGGPPLPNVISLTKRAARSRARVCGRSLAGTEGSNPAAGMDVRLLCVLCVVRSV